MSAWKDLFVPQPVLKALEEDNFSSPTPIQALALPSAIRDKLDIVGAAETGSGKTLAFAIPIIHHILERKNTKCITEPDESSDSADQDGSESSDEAQSKADELPDHVDTNESLDVAQLGTSNSSGDAEPPGKYVRPIKANVNGDSNISEKRSSKKQKRTNKTKPPDETSSESETEQDFKNISMVPEPLEKKHASGIMLSGKYVETLSLGIGLDFGGDESTDEEANLTPESEEDFGDDDNGVGFVRAMQADKQAQRKSKRSTYRDDSSARPLQALILTPTRELAIQVKKHIDRAARHTDIKTCVIVGGMAIEKQRRVLNKNPDIVVATPGRFWQVLEEKPPQLRNIQELPFLVIDEADRMVEKGHFEELSSLLNHLNSDEKKKAKRQTFVFSATLTLVHAGPDRRIVKKKRKHKVKTPQTKDAKLDVLMSTIGVRAKAKVIDLSQKQGTAESLVESRIMTSREDKDLYLYYFLQKYPGRTLVFANSKDAIRRLVSVLRLLQCKPLVLHADMRQKQRLKNLDRFRDDARGLLLATDVAARGLDIPQVEHVIHFQVPPTSENYIHRSGRTARALSEGLSVMLVSAEDISNYRKIIKTLNRSEELPLFPVEDEYMPVLRQRVAHARSVDQLQHSLAKRAHECNWFKKLADEADIELDEDTVYQVPSSNDDSHERIANERRLKALKFELDNILKMPIMRSQFSGKYPTKDGSVVMPYMNVGVDEKATNSLKQSLCSTKRKLDDAVAAPPRTKRKRFKRKH